MQNSNLAHSFKNKKLSLTLTILIFFFASLFSSAEANMSAIEDSSLGKVKSGDEVLQKQTEMNQAAHEVDSANRTTLELNGNDKNDFSKVMFEIGNLRKKKQYDDFLQHTMLILKTSKSNDFKNTLESDSFLNFSRKFASLANICLKEVLSLNCAKQNNEMESFFRTQKKFFAKPIKFYDNLMKFRKNGTTVEAMVKIIEDMEQDYNASENEYNNLKEKLSGEENLP